MKTLKKIVRISLVVIGIFYVALKPRFRATEETYPSPDGTYVLKVYVQTHMVSFGLRNDPGLRAAYVVLEDANGNVLCKPGIFSSCKNAIIEDVWGNWEEEDRKVYYTKFSYIDLETMEMHCLE